MTTDPSDVPPACPRKPLAYATVSQPSERSFARVASRVSIFGAAGIYLLNAIVSAGRDTLPANMPLVILMLSLVGVAAGFGLGIAAIVTNRHAKQHGVTGYAMAGLILNGLMLVFAGVLIYALKARI